MSLARKILDEANEDITTTKLYGVVQDNIPTIVDGLDTLSSEFKDAHSDTEVQDIDSFGKLYKALTNICSELDINGFTYFSQPTNFRKNVLSDVFNNFKEFYEEYRNGFSAEDIEILNTNSKDLLSILEKLK